MLCFDAQYLVTTIILKKNIYKEHSFYCSFCNLYMHIILHIIF